MEPKNEVDKFFEGLPKEDKQVADVFGDKKNSAGEASIVKDESSEKGELEPRKNRRHRRLEEALEKERSANIELNERLMKVIEGKNSPTASLDMPPEWIALYGDSDASEKAWKVQERMLESYGSRIKEETMSALREEEQTVEKQKRQFQEFIDEQFENLEDEYGVDLTSDSPAARKARYELLDAVEQLSPKNEDGLITGYADFGAAFDLYQKARPTEKTVDNSRAKELAAKSMQGSGQGSGQSSAKAPTPGFYGWKTDYNLQ